MNITNITDLPHPGNYARLMADIRRHDSERPEALTRNPFDAWRQPATVRDIRTEMRSALDRRINARGGQEWRNDTTALDIDLRRDQSDLDDILRRRIRVYQFRTDTCRHRFGHLLANRDD